MKITIVSPTYNEAENVPRLVREIAGAMTSVDYELLIADDDSPDRTWAVAQELSIEFPRVRVLRRTSERGLSAAVIDGFLSSSCEYIGVIDADLQHDPAIIQEMVAGLDNGAEIVVGSRYTEGGGTAAWNRARLFQSWVATKLAQTFLGVELTDPMSGYFVMRRREFMRVHKHLDSSGFKILLEIIARLGPSAVAEVPYTFRTREAGQSKLSSKIILEYLGQLWKLSSVSRHMSVRLVKFALVGGFGTVVNLGAFFAFSRFLEVQDWRISALASLLANVTNYIANNAWKLLARRYRGQALLQGYLSYFGFSLAGLIAATVTFAILGGLQSLKALGLMAALVFQLAAIGVGTVVNYELTSRFTWRGKEVDSETEPFTDTAPERELVSAGQRPAGSAR